MIFSAIAAKCRVFFALHFTKKSLIYCMRITLVSLIAITVTSQLLIASSARGQHMAGTKVQLELKNESLISAFRKIERETPFRFLYRNEDVESITHLRLLKTTAPVDQMLEALLRGTGLSFRQVSKHIVISKTEEKHHMEEAPVIRNEMPDPLEIRGRVIDETKEGIPGVSVWVKGTRIGAITDKSGYYRVVVPDSSGVLEFRFVGYVVKEISVMSGAWKLVTLDPDKKMLNEVVINTGMFERKAGSFTGAVSTYSAEDLKLVTNQNVLQGLAILDPSFQIVENNEFGSDPNRLPDIQMRGQTGFPDLTSDYSNVPNQPLFILDGFETTLQKVYDLNINIVKSITLLKDASAKAIYGAKAGNGVVVIETLTPRAGAMRVSYSGSLNVTAPDLRSYDLTNSKEKVQAEVLAGKYTSVMPETQASLTSQYTTNLKAALDGVDTYWLSQPLQNGYGQRHGLFMDGGDDAMRYSANINYNDVKGVMKGSDRKTFSGVVNLQYRLKDFAFRNNLSIDRNTGENSPYGSFSEYTRMNPYWRIYDDNGNLIPTYTSFGTTVANPLYNASLNTIDNSKYTMITENFYTEYSAMKNLRLTARVGVSMQNNESDLFYPASHTRFAGVSPSSPDYLNRGEYSKTNGKMNTYSADLLGAYNLEINKHQLLLNAGLSANENSAESTGFIMVGFPGDRVSGVAFGNMYEPGTKASGTENTSRTLGVTSAVNYAYDNRYLADLSYRANASSQFGANERWGSFWSAGLGWNIHNESFLKSSKAVNQLKIRGSVGSTGTQGFSSYQSKATYQYITSKSYNGDMGLSLMGLPNEDLMWQKVMEYNLGTDIQLFHRLSLRADYYIKDTEGLLSDQIIAPSAGFSSYKENLGEVRNEGYQLGSNLRVYSGNKSSVNIFLNAQHNSNKIRKVSNSLTALNRNNDDFTRGDDESIAENTARRQQVYSSYVEGASMSAIWVVKSLGIDPSNGKEIFLTKDGSQTYVWSTDDYIVFGDTNPDITGTFGSNVRIKNFTGNFAFTYRLGGQMYNETLVRKVENADFTYNVDARALQERWNTPGQQTLYKDIADLTPTQPTSRFVQDFDELVLSSISFGYNFNNLRIFKNSKASNLNAAVTLNDLARFSTVKTERGTDYPFARTISFSIQATF